MIFAIGNYRKMPGDDSNRRLESPVLRANPAIKFG